MHRTVIWRVVAALAVALVFILSVAAPALAEEPATGSTSDRPVVLQANADLTIAADTNWDTVVLFAADATVLGTVDTLLVVDGTATLTGAHVATLVVAGGAVDIQAGSVVDQVRTFDATYDVAAGASVGSQSALDPTAIAMSLAPLAIAMWIGAALAYVLAGLVVAAIAGGQLRRAGATITREPGVVTLAALGVLFGMPLLIAILAVTIVGIPTALTVAIIALPMVWFVGSVSVAVRIGDWIMLHARGRVEAAHPVVAALLGTLVVGVLSIIPLVGFLIGLAGAGAVSVVAWRAAFGSPDRGPATTVHVGVAAA